MAQREFVLSLQEIEFPFLSEQQGRNVFVKSDRYDSEVMAKIYYCHNVMPTKYGIKSIGYMEHITGTISTPLTDVRTVYSTNRNRTYIAWDNTGRVYALKLGTTTWIALPDTIPSTASATFSINNVTLGTVNGITYIFYKGIGCFKYNDSTNTLDAVTLTGVTIANVIGITGSFGYLITYTSTDIAWSSTLDPTDFTPSETTGAGGGSVNNLRGAIVFIITNSLGILIFSDTNTVAATYTGNSRYPFKFVEVANSRGGLQLDLVAYEANATSQFVISKGGLQAITSQKADIIFPELTDFIFGKRFEDLDETTQTFTITNLTTTMLKKIKFIAGRYLIVSYGITTYTHAIVYDTALKKFGKLKIDHIDCFDYIGDQEEIAKESIAFLLSNGTVKLVDFTVGASTDGVIFFGKLQYDRHRTFTCLGLEAENVESGVTCDAYIFNSYDGKKTETPVKLVEAAADTGLRKYYANLTGVNQSVLLIGDFDLTYINVLYILGGRR